MGGSFYGYREQLIPVSMRTPRLRPGGSVNPMKLNSALMEHLGVTAHDYRSFQGDAPRDYGDWTFLPWKCRMSKWTLDGGPLEIQITYDGSEIGDTRTLRSSLTTLDSFSGFRVRQLVPGFSTWYQCVAIL